MTRLKGRKRTIQTTTLSLDKEAYEVLRVLAPTHLSYGSYVSRLLLNEMSRIEGRKELLRRLIDKSIHRETPIVL
jgi:hypothetical protein